MSDDWDADDFEPPPPVLPKDQVKTQWDDDEEEEEEEPVKETPGDASTAKSAEKSKPKAAPKKKKGDKAEEERLASEVLADPVAEKLRQQRLVEESDFKATRDLFGGETKETERSLDGFIPKAEAEFEEFAGLVAGKVTPFSKSFHYIPLLKAFLRKATETLTSTEAKQLSMTLSAISNEKLKQEKEAAGAKKKGGAKKQQLRVDKAEEDDYGGGRPVASVDEDYDFM